MQPDERLLGELVSNPAVTGHRLAKGNQSREVLTEALLEAALSHHHISLHVPGPAKGSLAA